MNTSLFDKMLIAMAAVFTATVIISYWYPGSNPDAFKVIETGALGAIGIFLIKKANSEA